MPVNCVSCTIFALKKSTYFSDLRRGFGGDIPLECLKIICFSHWSAWAFELCTIFTAVTQLLSHSFLTAEASWDQGPTPQTFALLLMGLVCWIVALLFTFIGFQLNVPRWQPLQALAQSPCSCILLTLNYTCPETSFSSTPLTIDQMFVTFS